MNAESAEVLESQGRAVSLESPDTQAKSRCEGPSRSSSEVRRRDPAWERLMRRLLDITVASAGLLVTWPVILYYGLRVKQESPGPMFHLRKVVKRGGGTFFAYKIRTMIENADDLLNQDPKLREVFEKNYKLNEDPRVTPTGRFLRTSSIDELPQFLNVLRGEMSIVGPRMITEPELLKYGPHGKKLLTVKPGLTGYWQVSGRQHVAYDERVMLDMEYIDRRNLWFDLYILFKTPLVVLRRTGAL